MGLKVLIDYDNVPANVWAPGPIAAAEALCARLPASVVGSEKELTVRLYGGWRSASKATARAQKLIPQLDAESHRYVSRPGHSAEAAKIRLVVQLALSPLGSSSVFDTTLARERSIRSFRPRASSGSPCADPSACGLGFLTNLTHQSLCLTSGCASTPQDLLVRDEQKMVDTLMVADMAHAAFVDCDRDIVVITSDTDIWPGVLLAIKGGCAVTQVHPKQSASTHPALVGMLPHAMQNYFQQISI